MVAVEPDTFIFGVDTTHLRHGSEFLKGYPAWHPCR